MSELLYEKAIPGKVQADGNQTITIMDADTSQQISLWSHRATKHQVTIVPEGATSGTVAVFIKRQGGTAFHALKDAYGAPVVLNIAAPEPWLFEGRVLAIQFRPSSVTGGAGTYTCHACGWN